MASKFLKYLFILYFTFFSVSPTFASSISPLTVPTCGQVASGTININQSAPGKLVVNQTTNQGIINWQSFNVGVDAAVHFNTPNASAGTLNNISGGSSTILGSIFSNGRLFFANPSGIIFKPGSQVKAEGLVASAMRISNQDFLANNFNFTNNQIASLQNEGDLQAQYVALIAPQVLNKGTITTNVATTIAAGDDVKLSISDSNRLSVNINPAKIKTLSANEGVIKSENGTVSIQANIAQELIDQTINTPKSADKLISENGVIKLVSNSGSIKSKNVNLSAGRLGGTEVSGNIDASSNTKGGDIEITGKEINVKSNSTLLATGETGGGNILVGGDWQGSNGVLQATYTTVEKDTLIDTSSKGVGNGGKIVVWSDVKDPNSKTTTRGQLSSKANIGDGGKIETSGSTLDTLNTTVNTSSVTGNYGTWLIDPTEINIDAAAASTYVTNLIASDVDIQAENTINVNSSITYSGDRSNGTLTFTAPTTVLNAPVTSTSQPLNVTFNADKVEGAGNLSLRGGILTVDVSESSSEVVNPYSGVLSNLSLNKQGVGMLKLSGANTYTGATTISAGTLSVTGSLGRLNKSKYTYAGNIANSGTLAMGSSSEQTLSGVISGTGALTKSGSGRLNLSGINTYEGATTISAGSLAAGSLADTTALSVASGATYLLDGSDTVGSIAGAGNINLLNRTLTIAGDSDTNFSGVISGIEGRLTKSGSGTLTLSGINTYSGVTTISAGTLAVTASRALGSARSSFGTTVASGATLDFHGSYSEPEAITVNGGTIKTSTGASITLSSTIALSANSNFDVVGGTSLTSTVSGTSGGLTKSGSGTLTLSGTNYRGTASEPAAITISAGTLSASDLHAFTALSVESGATYQLTTYNDTVASIAGAGNINLEKYLTIAGASDTNFSGIISGTGGLTKSGLGTLTLSGTNTYTGATTVSAGTLAVTANNALGTNAAGTTVASGATLDFDGVNYSTTEAITVNGGTIKTSTGASTVAGTIALGANSNFNVVGTSLTSSGVISGAGGLTKSGSGTLTLSGINTYTGPTIVSAGTLSVTGTLNSGNYAGNIANSGILAMGSSSSQTLSGVVSGAGALTKSGSGTLTLSGTNTYEGATTISAGTLSVTGTLGSGTYAGNIANSGTLAMGSNSNQTLSGVISGTGALTKSGSGTLILLGTNTYTGTTTVSAGTFFLKKAFRLHQKNIEKASVVKIVSKGTNAMNVSNNNMTFKALAGPNFGPSPASSPKNLGPASGVRSGPQIKTISRFIRSATKINNVKRPVRLRQTNLRNKPIQIQPNNQPIQIQPNNQSIQTKPNNQPIQIQPNNQSIQTQPNNQSPLAQPNNQSTQTQPNNQSPLAQPNNEQNPVQSPIESELDDGSL